MEIQTIIPEDIKAVATSTARVVPVDEIDATFKSQYTGAHFRSRDAPIGTTANTKEKTSSPHLSAPRYYPSATNGLLPPRTSSHPHHQSARLVFSHMLVRGMMAGKHDVTTLSLPIGSCYDWALRVEK